MSTHKNRSSAHQDDLGVLLTLALEAFKDRLHEHLAQAGFDDLGPSFGFVFRSLADNPLSLAELAAGLGMSAPGALKIVATMIERGYVERREDLDDARVKRLALTRRGRRALDEARSFHATAERELVASVGKDSVASARAVLQALAGHVSTEGIVWPAGARPF